VHRLTRVIVGERLLRSRPERGAPRAEWLLWTRSLYLRLLCFLGPLFALFLVVGIWTSLWWLAGIAAVGTGALLFGLAKLEVEVRRGRDADGAR
jgi:hypothetical protein